MYEKNPFSFSDSFFELNVNADETRLLLPASKNTLNNRSTRRAIKKFFSKLHQKYLAGHEIDVIQNVLCDFAWTELCIDEKRFDFKRTHDENFDYKGQPMGQFIYASLIMLTLSFMVAALETYRNFKTKTQINIQEASTPNISYLKTKRSLVMLVTCAFTILSWDYGQELGQHLGTKYFGLDTFDAALFSSFFAGWFASPIQLIMPRLLECMLSKALRQQILPNMKLIGIETFIQLLLCFCPGFLPGALWQGVFAMCVFGNINPWLSGFFVALAVAPANLLELNLEDKVHQKLEKYFKKPGFFAEAAVEQEQSPQRPYTACCTKK